LEPILRANTKPETINQKQETGLLQYLKLQKGLADYYLIAVLKRVSFAGKKPSTAIYKSAVGGAEILDEILTVMIDDSRVSPGDLCFGIVLIQVYVREYAAIGVPAANVCLDAAYWKFFADSSAPFDDEPRQGAHVILVKQRIFGVQRTGVRRRSQSDCVLRRGDGMIGPRLIRFESGSGTLVRLGAAGIRAAESGIDCRSAIARRCCRLRNAC